MGLAYEVTRGGLFSDQVTRQRAGELYEQARVDPASDLVGDAVAGFAYWVVDVEGVRLVRVRVEPVTVEV